MTTPRSVGSASVTITPDAREFVTKLRAELLPSADKIGEELGKVIGDAIQRQIKLSTENTQIGPGPSRSREQGSSSAGAFADGFKARLEAAIKSLPKIQIGAASNEADQKIKDLQTDLIELSGKKIGVDISDEEAVAKLTDLRERLAEINASATSIQLKADTGAALAQIDRLKAEIEKITQGEQDVDVDVDVDDHGTIAETEAKIAALDETAGASGDGFSIFGGKIALIGVAAVAAADVAIPAILAIGAAAAGALAGLGVGFLGLSGVGDALQAHEKKAPSGGTGVASAGLSQQSAQLTAAQATRTAQDNLTTAIQNQTKAEKDLHDARVQAQRDIEDLDNKLKDNTLDLTQAQLTLREAQEKLALINASAGASLPQYADQVKQAQLDVAQGQQKVNELTQQSTRLAQDDAKAHLQGVEGSDKVVKARTDLINANRKLSEAQDNITETAKKNKIALEQAALGMVSAGAAADSFGAAMAKLNPLQKDFVNFLLSLKPLLDELKLAASAFLPGLQAGIQGAVNVFPQIVTIVKNVATAMGTVFANIGKQFQTPEGKRFLAFLADELPKQIVFLGNLFIDFGKILSGIFEAAGPLIDATDQAITGFFDNTAKGANGSGLKQFFDSLIPLVKPIGQALAAVFGLVGTVLKALTPALGPVLHLITLIADSIGVLVSGPVGQALIRTFADLVTAVTPLVPLFLQILQTVLPPLISLLDTLVTGGIAPLVTALASALQPVLPVIATYMNQLVKAIAPLIPQIVTSLVPILPQLASAWIAVINAMIPLIPQFANLFKQIVPIIPPLVQLTNAFLSLVTKSLPYITPLLKIFVATLAPFAGAVKPFADAIKFLADQLQRVADLIPKLPHIPGLDLGPHTTIGDNVHINPVLLNPGPSGTKNTNPAKAAGGPVFPGQAYKVDEFGPEMFIPNVAGRIVNADASRKIIQAQRGGAGGRPITVNNYSVDPLAAGHATVARLAARAV